MRRRIMRLARLMMMMMKRMSKTTHFVDVPSMATKIVVEVL